MKYTATLKTLKEITGIDNCEGLTVDISGYRYNYEDFKYQVGVRLYCSKDENGITCIVNSRPIPLTWLKDIKLIKEYTDWTKVKKDTKIIVWSNRRVFKEKRHFAYYKDGKVYAYVEGNTSWSSNNNTSMWDNAELAEDETENK